MQYHITNQGDYYRVRCDGLETHAGDFIKAIRRMDRVVAEVH